MAARRGQEATISHNTWIHRVVRVGVRPLATTRVTPNHLTTARLVAGLAAAAAFAVGTPPWTLAACGIFVVSVLLDRADGELARLSGRTSRFGHIYDFISDGFSNTAVFVGIGFGLGDTALGGWAPALGLVAGASAALIEVLVVLLDAMGRSSARLGGFHGFDPDDAILIVPLALALGYGVPLIVAAAIGAPVALMVFAVLYGRTLRARSRTAEAADHRR
jgi:phosphatidylglycerophosphate synthase